MEENNANSTNTKPNPGENKPTYSQKVINQLLLAPEGKREEFRLYLERSHILEVLNQFFVGLYNEIEKPENVIEYLLENLTAVVPFKSKVDNLNSDVAHLHRRFADLEQDNQRLRERLEMYEQASHIPHELLGEHEEINANVDTITNQIEKLTF